MTPPTVVADPRFPALLKQLRVQRRWSLRRFATVVNYSHTYLWELEVGRKPPTVLIAEVLDKALDAYGQLAQLVTEKRGPVPDPPGRLHPPGSLSDSPPLESLAACRRELEDAASQARLTRHAARMQPGQTYTSVLGIASQWAQVASWLYDLFVRQRPPLLRLGPNRYSHRLRAETGVTPFRSEAIRQGRTPRTECRSISRRPAPADVRRRLGAPEGGTYEVVRRENWYFADEEPVQTGVTYVPQHIAGDSPIGTDKALGPGGIYARFEELGYPVARIREEVSARLPTPSEAAALRIPPGVPVLEVLHTSYDSTSHAFEVTRVVLRGDLSALDYEMPIED